MGKIFFGPIGFFFCCSPSNHHWERLALCLFDSPKSSSYNTSMHTLVISILPMSSRDGGTKREREREATSLLLVHNDVEAVWRTNGGRTTQQKTQTEQKQGRPRPREADGLLGVHAGSDVSGGRAKVHSEGADGLVGGQGSEVKCPHWEYEWQSRGRVNSPMDVQDPDVSLDARCDTKF